MAVVSNLDDFYETGPYYPASSLVRLATLSFLLSGLVDTCGFVLPILLHADLLTAEGPPGSPGTPLECSLSPVRPEGLGVWPLCTQGCNDVKWGVAGLSMGADRQSRPCGVRGMDQVGDHS